MMKKNLHEIDLMEIIRFRIKTRIWTDICKKTKERNLHKFREKGLSLSIRQVEHEMMKKERKVATPIIIIIIIIVKE